MRNALIANPSLVSQVPAIRVVEYKGKLWTLDNRRLATFKAAQLSQIPVVRVSLDDPAILKQFNDRFHPIEGGHRIVVVIGRDRLAAVQLLKKYGKHSEN